MGIFPIRNKEIDFRPNGQSGKDKIRVILNLIGDLKLKKPRFPLQILNAGMTILLWFLLQLIMYRKQISFIY